MQIDVRAVALCEASHADVVEWSRSALVEFGFEGFVRFGDLTAGVVPRSQGVYVVVRERTEEPSFLDRNPAGWAKGKDPSATASALQAAWVPTASVLYIGKASSGHTGRRGLCTRLDEFRRHGAGEPVGHWGGRYVWQIQDSSELLVAWKVTPAADPEEMEAELIEQFAGDWGSRPFANRKAGRSTPRG